MTKVREDRSASTFRGWKGDGTARRTKRGVSIWKKGGEGEGEEGRYAASARERSMTQWHTMLHENKNKIRRCCCNLCQPGL